MNDLRSVKERFGIIGQSSLLDSALGTAIRVSSTDLSVLISGESGVGKEAFSKIIHHLSPRKHEGFIAINCSAIPEGTINSELFGHEKGAFTGAVSERKGYFETYNGGTIFLDEIGDMPLDTQSYLLRILESGEFIRMGSSRVLHTDIRVIAATNVDLNDLIRKGKFREDLYYRLNTVPIRVPPLRERREDIYLLFRKFVADFADKYGNRPIRLDEEARQLLESYQWPGNVRELKNVAEQISILSDSQMIGADELEHYIPDISKRNLPATLGQDPESAALTTGERDLFYRFLLDMRKDLDQVKQVLSGLISKNDLDVAEGSPLVALENQNRPPVPYQPDNKRFPTYPEKKTSEPIILEPKRPGPYNESEVIDESLDLIDMEKRMISKALDKHRGKRKEAAADLGISERTLYRKIKQYELP